LRKRKVRKILSGSPRGLATTANPGLVVQEESPWDTFRKVYDCDLAGTVTVTVRRSTPVRVHKMPMRFCVKQATTKT